MRRYYFKLDRKKVNKKGISNFLPMPFCTVYIEIKVFLRFLPFGS